MFGLFNTSFRLSILSSIQADIRKEMLSACSSVSLKNVQGHLMPSYGHFISGKFLVVDIKVVHPQNSVDI